VGIAPQLVQRGVPAVLTMQYKVRVRTAKIFLESFYTAVAARKPIDWATQSARNAVSQELGLDNRESALRVASPFWCRHEHSYNVGLKALDRSAHP